uniref:Hcf106/Tha4 n=1 Tax=Nitzschia sp. IriIs04 TaxID=1444690 RepID=A0A0P0YVB1_9STRA|nr:Hcf106/Tha4 [Nitzschia sp. IriIs04]
MRLVFLLVLAAAQQASAFLPVTPMRPFQSISSLSTPATLTPPTPSTSFRPGNLEGTVRSPRSVSGTKLHAGIFGIGAYEFAIILLAAALVLGPDRVGKMSQDLGRMAGELKEIPEEFNKGFQDALDGKDDPLKTDEQAQAELVKYKHDMAKVLGMSSYESEPDENGKVHTVDLTRDELPPGVPKSGQSELPTKGGDQDFEEVVAKMFGMSSAEVRERLSRPMNTANSELPDEAPATGSTPKENVKVDPTTSPEGSKST